MLFIALQSAYSCFEWAGSIGRLLRRFVETALPVGKIILVVINHHWYNYKRFPRLCLYCVST